MIELIIAVFMISGVVAMLSLLFPTASQSIVNNRQRLAALNIAASQIDDLKKQPYSYIDVTGTALPVPASFGTSLCQCNTVNYATFPSNAVIPSTGTTFTKYVCVNFVTYDTVNKVWNPQCSTAGDTGYKNIHVHVSWFSQEKILSVDQESIATRY